MKVTRESVVNDLMSFDIRKGDTVFLRAGLSKIGLDDRKDILVALKEVVGTEGTIVVLGFTQAFKSRHSRSFKDHVFDAKKTMPNIGALSNLVFADQDAKRSKHPTNSFIALGPKAKIILDDHDEKSMCYTPMKSLIELKAKMLLIGCIEDSPGFTTVHYAQEVLGLTKKSWFSGIYKSQYQSQETVKTFVKEDFGGCSEGFSNFYHNYRSEGVLSEGKIGNADSYCLDADQAFKIEYEILQQDPKYFLCKNPTCLVCRTSWKFNRADILKYIYAKSKEILIR